MVDTRHAVMAEPIVGYGPVLSDERGDGAISPVPLKSPKTMTPSEKEKHDITHLPPDDGCVICRSTRTPNLGHFPSHEHLRRIPLLVGDYCLVRNTGDDVLVCVLVQALPVRDLFRLRRQPQGLRR